MTPIASQRLGKHGFSQQRERRLHDSKENEQFK
jgi:hypothetical protein